MLNRHLTVDTPSNPRYWQSSARHVSAASEGVTAVRRMIWLYCWLLIFEGALRKWIPPLSVPLLVVRDPLVLLIYIQAVRCRRFPINGAMVTYFCLLSLFILLALVQ